MEALLIAVAYAQPFVLAFCAALLLVVIGGLAWNYRLLPGLAFLVLLFTFSSSRYGVLEGSASTIYTRGSGQLFFPFVVWGLLLGAVWMSFANKVSLGRSKLDQPLPSIQVWFLLWFLLLCSHVFVGLFHGQPLSVILSSEGFVYVPLLGALIALLLAGARNTQSMATLALFLEVAAFFKAGFGLIRWAAFGGDPANVYANVEKLAVKLTFFEIGDSLVIMLGLAVAASMLFLRPVEHTSPWRRALHWAVLVMGLACLLLSFRRTVWLGLFLSFAWLLWRLKPAHRWQALLIVLPLLAAGVGYVATKRLGAQVEKLGVWAMVYDLIASKHGSEGGRALELRLAAQEFLASPLWGNGAWGSYGFSTRIAWQDSVRGGTFLHSGILHIAMKTGLLGVGLTVGLLVSFVRQLRCLGKTTPEGYALLAAACMGLLMMLPDFLVGTPVVQFRTTQLIGVCLALPFFVARADSFRLQAQQDLAK